MPALAHLHGQPQLLDAVLPLLRPGPGLVIVPPQEVAPHEKAGLALLRPVFHHLQEEEAKGRGQEGLPRGVALAAGRGVPVRVWRVVRGVDGSCRGKVDGKGHLRADPEGRGQVEGRGRGLVCGQTWLCGWAWLCGRAWPVVRLTL